MPASFKIDTPTAFAQWAQTKALFDDGTAMTETYVTDGHELGVRLAYGRSPEGFWFYISMTPAEEPEFWQAYQEWFKRNQVGNRHITSVIVDAPPASCGTPNTPPSEAQLMAGPLGAMTAGAASASLAVKAA
jgi:hypothetical protein